MNGKSKKKRILNIIATIIVLACSPVAVFFYITEVIPNMTRCEVPTLRLELTYFNASGNVMVDFPHRVYEDITFYIKTTLVNNSIYIFMIYPDNNGWDLMFTVRGEGVGYTLPIRLKSGGEIKLWQLHQEDIPFPLDPLDCIQVSEIFTIRVSEEC